MYTTILFLHVLAATIWTGGHIVLSLVVLPQALRRKDAERLLAFETRYEKVGIPSLVVQVVTGLWLAYRLVPNPADWLGFGGGLAGLVSAKLLLLALTAALAVDARLRIIPNLQASDLKALAYHVIPVTILSILFVFVGVSFRTGSLF